MRHSIKRSFTVQFTVQLRRNQTWKVVAGVRCTHLPPAAVKRHYYIQAGDNGVPLTPTSASCFRYKMLGEQGTAP